jgi:hypothetical protein
MNVAFGSSNG